MNYEKHLLMSSPNSKFMSIKNSSTLSFLKYLGILILFCLVFLVFYVPNTTNAKEEDIQGKYSVKDEVVYGNLTGNGDIKKLYVVNSFQVTKPGSIKDYGLYSNVRNLTDLSEMSLQKNVVTFQADKGNFYYQGDLETKTLPWNIDITYLLDGKEVKPNDLAGKNGHLEIRITTTKNKQVNPIFFDYYVLQIAVTLDPIYFQNIHAPKATEANEGKNKLFSFNVMPEQEAELILSADVKNMKLEPINISGVPANIAMEEQDIEGMTDEMEELSNAIADINNGVGELTNGLTKWRNGATELEKGSANFKDGLDELNNSSEQLIQGSEQLLQVMKQVKLALQNIPDLEAMNELNNVQQLPDLLREGAAGLQQFSNQIDIISDEWNQLQESPISDADIQRIIKLLEENEVDQEMIVVLQQLQQFKSQIDQVMEQPLIPKDIQQDIQKMTKELQTAADFIQNNMSQLEQLTDLEKLLDGIKTLTVQYETFHNGLLAYTDGIQQLAKSYTSIDDGITDITDGAAALEDGANTLHQGTQTLQENTEGLPNNVQSEVDKLMDEFDFSDFEPTSFVSKKNKKADVVQFVLKTEKIELPEQEKAIKETESKNLWERFLDLFT